MSASRNHRVSRFARRTAVGLVLAGGLGGCAELLSLGTSSATPSAEHESHEPPPTTDPAGKAIRLTGGTNLTLDSPALELRVRASHGALPAKGGKVVLRYDVAGAPPASPRAPVALAVVFDRSTSMADGEKLLRTIEAGKFVLRNLGPSDFITLISFADDVRVVMPLSRAVSLSCLEYGLDGIMADGNTNISGGLLEGFAQVLDESFTAYRRHVILLTDGLANRGVTHTPSLTTLAADQRAKGATLSTIGVGTDFDGELLEALAASGGGTYHHLADAGEIPNAFRAELGELKPVAAQNVVLELRWTMPSGRKGTPAPLRIPIGDVYAEDATMGVKVFEVPEAPAGSSVRLDASITYDDPTRGRFRRDLSASIPVVTDAAVVTKGEASEILAYARFASLVGRIEAAAHRGALRKARSLAGDAKELYARLRDWAILHGDQSLMNRAYMLNHAVDEAERGGSMGGHGHGSAEDDSSTGAHGVL